MQIVIDVPDEDYKRIKDMPDAFNSLTSRAYKSIKNGTPLPKGHGRLIDADAINIHDVSPAYGMEVYGVTQDDIEYEPTIIEADKEVWNADSD